jgi:hypothetical protein
LHRLLQTDVFLVTFAVVFARFRAHAFHRKDHNSLAKT